MLSLKRDSRGSSVHWKRVRIWCHHGCTGSSDILDSQQKRGRSPMTAQLEQRDVVPRENISRAM